MAHLPGEAQRKRENRPLSLSIRALALNYITTATPKHRRRHRQAAPFSRTQTPPRRGMTDAFTRP